MSYNRSARRGRGSSPPPDVHDGVGCDVCDEMPIVGMRYKCRDCPNFDLCPKCISRGPSFTGHSPVHFFVGLTTAETMSLDAAYRDTAVVRDGSTDGLSTALRLAGEVSKRGGLELISQIATAAYNAQQPKSHESASDARRRVEQEARAGRSTSRTHTQRRARQLARSSYDSSPDSWTREVRKGDEGYGTRAQGDDYSRSRSPDTRRMVFGDGGCGGYGARAQGDKYDVSNRRSIRRLVSYDKLSWDGDADYRTGGENSGDESYGMGTRGDDSATRASPESWNVGDGRESRMISMAKARRSYLQSSYSPERKNTILEPAAGSPATKASRPSVARMICDSPSGKDDSRSQDERISGHPAVSVGAGCRCCQYSFPI